MFLLKMEHTFAQVIGSAAAESKTETADYFGEWKIANNFVLTHWMALPKLPEDDA